MRESEGERQRERGRERDREGMIKFREKESWQPGQRKTIKCPGIYKKLKRETKPS